MIFLSLLILITYSPFIVSIFFSTFPILSPLFKLPFLIIWAFVSLSRWLSFLFWLSSKHLGVSNPNTNNYSDTSLFLADTSFQAAFNLIKASLHLSTQTSTFQELDRTDITRIKDLTLIYRGSILVFSGLTSLRSEDSSLTHIRFRCRSVSFI